MFIDLILGAQYQFCTVVHRRDTMIDRPYKQFIL